MMKRIGSVLILLLWLGSAASGQDNPASQAYSLYQMGDYAGAIREYQELLARGVNDGAVHFNLAAAYFQSGELGRALVHLRRAQALMPRDRDVADALAMIRMRRIDTPGEDVGLLESLAVAAAGVATIDELAGGSMLLWALFFLLILALLRVSQRAAGLLFVLAAVGCALLLSLALLFSRLYIESSRPAAVVIAPEVPVMSGPGESYLVLYRLHSAAEIRIVDRRAGWLRFTLPNQRQGWIAAGSIEEV